MYVVKLSGTLSCVTVSNARSSALISLFSPATSQTFRVTQLRCSAVYIFQHRCGILDSCAISVLLDGEHPVVQRWP